jgi:hypothetical protein
MTEWSKLNKTPEAKLRQMEMASKVRDWLNVLPLLSSLAESRQATGVGSLSHYEDRRPDRVQTTNKQASSSIETTKRVTV